MKSRIKLIIFFVLIFVSFTAFAEDKSFTEKESEALKELADLWTKGKIVTSWVSTFWIPIAGIIGAALGALGMWAFVRTRIEAWFITDFAKKLKTTEESFSLVVDRLTKDLEIRKGKKILIVGEEVKSAGLKAFLETNDYKLIQPLVTLTALASMPKSNFDLIIFNYLNEDLEIEQSKFGSQLSDCKGKTRALVLGKGRLDNKYSLELGFYLSLANGTDVLDDRILQSLKQPLPIS